MTQAEPARAVGPLAGVRIVEFDAIGPVPLAAMILADMSADIVRLVRPGAAGDAGGAVLHRSRTAVRVDLKDAADRDGVIELVGGADAVVEGFRPGVLERLGLGPDVLLARNPALVVGRMTGWGQDGPLAQRAGHDINYIAITGALHAIGARDAPPTVPLNLIGDYGGGAMFLVAGVLAGLLAVRAGAPGQVVDVAMTEGAVTLMSMFHAFAASGRWTDTRAANLLDGGAPFYRCYTCADGGHVAVGCLEPHFFAACLAGLGIDAREVDQYDTSQWPVLEARLAAAFATRTRDDWAAVFADTDACVTPVLSIAEAPGHPHNAARGSHVLRDGIAQAAPAPRFDPPATIREPGTRDLAAAIDSWRDR